MAVLLLLGYAAICVAAFKILRVTVNQWTVTTAAITGVVVVGGLMLGMNYNHPFTTDGRLYFFTTSIVPTVKGPVIEVAVKPNLPLKQGDLLFRVDPRPYQFVVRQKKAALVEAEQNVRQLKASLDQAGANVQKAKADADLAQQNYNRQVELFEKRIIAQAALDTAIRNLAGGKQTLTGAEAAAERARLAFASEIGGVNTTVARLQADLGNAEYDLAQTSVTAPTDGYVTQLMLRPGMMASPSSATMVFIHSNDTVFAASFAQNTTARVRTGDEAEIAFDALPGRIFKGKIAVVADAVAQGQLQATGALLNPEDRSKAEGRAVARIDITDDLSSYRLPPGAVAQVAVYSDHWKSIAVMRRMLLRMKSWMNYVAV